MLSPFTLIYHGHMTESFILEYDGVCINGVQILRVTMVTQTDHVTGA